MDELDKLGAVDSITHTEQTAWEDAKLEELCDGLVLVGCVQRQADGQTGRRVDRQTGRQTDRQTDRQTGRQTGR